MTKNNRAIMDEIQRIVTEGEALDVKTRDRLLLTAIIDIYDQLEAMQPAMTFYRVGLAFASLLGAAAFALLWSLLTGQVVLVFK